MTKLAICERIRAITSFAIMAVVLLGIFVDLSGERQWQVALIGAVIGGGFVRG